MHLTLTYPIQSSGRFFTRSNVRGYCFGFNGKEKVDEVYGDANAYDFGARLYDPRLGRWLAVDPLAGKFPDQSPYDYAFDSPIVFIDADGKEPTDRWRYDFKTGTLQWVSNEGGDEYDIIEFHNIPNETQEMYGLNSSAATLKIGVEFAFEKTIGSTDTEVFPGLRVFKTKGIDAPEGHALEWVADDPITALIMGGLMAAAKSFMKKPKEAPNNPGVIENPLNTTRGRNKLKPDPDAKGSHTTFKRGNDGKVYKYETYDKTNSGHYNPVKRYDGGKPDGSPGAPHDGVSTPHIQEKGVKGARKPETWEIPKGSSN